MLVKSNASNPDFETTPSASGTDTTSVTKGAECLDQLKDALKMLHGLEAAGSKIKDTQADPL